MNNAINKVKAHLTKATNTALADTLEIAVTGNAPGVDVPKGDKRKLRRIEQYIREEARHRVGTAANKAADADREIFNTRWGINEHMNEDELDQAYDRIPEEDFQKLQGEWFYLVAELRK